MPSARRLAVAALLLTLAAPALAADPAPPAKPAESKPAAAAAVKPGASDLARVLMPKKTWDDGLAALAKNVQAQMTMHPGGSKLQVPADLNKQIRTELDQALPYEALLDMHAQELSAAYTEPELKDLLAFYKTPVGQKSLTTMGTVSEKVSMRTQERIESKMPDIMKKVGSSVKAPAGKKAPAGHGAPAASSKPAAKPASPAK
ncbi:DUF2059 domain-containing protein [Anaeromyxobacter sp. Fw109-5]|uniref:DUF2059 domain-containing protein n=1 Tax=Anaeromyxobacter sp. (strain Fw109-5) TaxID=404589 RepID=UPI0000ED7E8F|nr:DUF2059 domain-containing protein [Anaeromyxobacter sp. Fw109-5]ABS27102.1 conserved hypothetical protein [Anaeromyxobacter sp. Fw109-5]